MTMTADAWRMSIPVCLADSCGDAVCLGEAVWFAILELDLIEEGQEAAECYTKREVKQIRKFIKDNQLSLRIWQSGE